MHLAPVILTPDPTKPVRVRTTGGERESRYVGLPTASYMGQDDTPTEPTLRPDTLVHVVSLLQRLLDIGPVYSRRCVTGGDGHSQGYSGRG